MHPQRFFRLLFSSITTPTSYIHILNAPLGMSVRFLLISYALLALLGAGLFAFNDIPIIDERMHTYIREQIAAYPDDLTLTWQNGVLQSSSATSHMLPFPDLPALSELEGLPKFLLEVQPAVVTLSDIETNSQAPALLILGRSSLFAREIGQGWSEYELTANPSESASLSATLTKSSLVAQQDQLLSTSRIAVRLLVLAFPFFFFFLSFPLRILSVLLDSCVLYFCSRILGFALPFRKVIQLSLHIMVVAEIIALLTAPFTTELPMFSLAFWGYTLVIYWHLRHVRMLPLTAAPDQDST